MLMDDKLSRTYQSYDDTAAPDPNLEPGDGVPTKQDQTQGAVPYAPGDVIPPDWDPDPKPKPLNYQYLNNNPNPTTICDACKACIGRVYASYNRPVLPRHPKCFCYHIALAARSTLSTTTKARRPTTARRVMKRRSRSISGTSGIAECNHRFSAAGAGQSFPSFAQLAPAAIWRRRWQYS